MNVVEAFETADFQSTFPRPKGFPKGEWYCEYLTRDSQGKLHRIIHRAADDPYVLPWHPQMEELLAEWELVDEASLAKERDELL